MMAAAVSSHAASITLESINSGVYQYQLALAPGAMLFSRRIVRSILRGWWATLGDHLKTGHT